MQTQTPAVARTAAAWRTARNTAEDTAYAARTAKRRAEAAWRSWNQTPATDGPGRDAAYGVALAWDASYKTALDAADDAEQAAEAAGDAADDAR